MPLGSSGFGIGGGGTGFALGPVNNLFGATSGDASVNPRTVSPASSLSAAESVRDAYATANPTWLASYDADNELNIILLYTSASNIFVLYQVRSGSAWVTNSSVVALQGEQGGMGNISPGDEAILDSFASIAEGRLVVRSADGLTQIPAMYDSTLNRVVFEMPIQSPEGIFEGNTVFVSENLAIGGSGLAFSIFDIANDRYGFLVGYRYTSTGSTVPFYRKLNPGSPQQQLTKDTNSGSANFQTTITTSGDFLITKFVTESTETATGEIVIRETSHTGQEIGRYEIAFTANTPTTIFDVFANQDSPIFVENATTYYITVSGVTLKGTGTGNNFEVYMQTEGLAWQERDILTVDDFSAEIIRDELATLTGNDRLSITNLKDVDETVEDIIGTKVVAGTGISVSYNDTNGETTISATSTSFDAPRITNFAIDIPSRINQNTDLNVSKTLTFDLIHSASIQGNLTLEVTTGTNQTVSSPFVEGANSKTVTLAGINTSSVSTLTFKLTGTDTQGNTFESNTVTVSVRTPSAHEQFYYGLSNTNNPASIDTSTMVSNEATTGTHLVATGAVTSGQYFIILVPTDHDITSIVDDVLQQDVTSIFTKTTNVRLINSQQYNSYVVGPLNAIGSENYTITLT